MQLTTPGHLIPGAEGGLCERIPRVLREKRGDIQRSFSCGRHYTAKVKTVRMTLAEPSPIQELAIGDRLPGLRGESLKGGRFFPLHRRDRLRFWWWASLCRTVFLTTPFQT